MEWRRLAENQDWSVVRIDVALRSGVEFDTQCGWLISLTGGPRFGQLVVVDEAATWLKSVWVLQLAVALPLIACSCSSVLDLSRSPRTQSEFYEAQAWFVRRGSVVWLLLSAGRGLFLLAVAQCRLHLGKREAGAP